MKFKMLVSYNPDPQGCHATVRLGQKLLAEGNYLRHAEALYGWIMDRPAGDEIEVKILPSSTYPEPKRGKRLVFYIAFSSGTSSETCWRGKSMLWSSSGAKAAIPTFHWLLYEDPGTTVLIKIVKTGEVPVKFDR